MSELANFESGGDCASEATIPDPVIAAPTPATETPVLNPDAWRVEVAARLERYRTRRKPRTPRYPSLLLPFEVPESWSSPSVPEQSSTASMPAAQDIIFVGRTGAADPASSLPLREQFPEPAKIIEFPRSAALPVFHRAELADAVLDPDRPRIVEAPEILPPPPALGGMLMEPSAPEPVARPDMVSVPSASIALRALAALVDGTVVLTSVVLFAVIVLRLNPGLISNSALAWSPRLPFIRGPLLVCACSLAGIAILMGAIYQFLL